MFGCTTLQCCRRPFSKAPRRRRQRFGHVWQPKSKSIQNQNKRRFPQTTARRSPPAATRWTIQAPVFASSLPTRTTTRRTTTGLLPRQRPRAVLKGALRVGKVVTAYNHKYAVDCSFEMCAERLLLQKVIHDVESRGRPTLHAVRKAMGKVTVERARADGLWGCSKPCCGCSMALARYDIRVRYYDGTVWSETRSAELQSSKVTVADQRRWSA